jgi:hypothetical protein
MPPLDECNVSHYITQMSFQSNRALCLPSPPGRAWDVGCYADDILARKWPQTAVASMILSPNADHSRGLAALLERLALGESEGLSQREFWRLYQDIQGGKGPDLYLVDGQQRLVAVDFKAIRNSMAHGVEETQAWLSARDRAEILATLTHFYSGLPDEGTSITALRAVLAAQVGKRLVVRVCLPRRPVIFDVPSTQSWVHHFMLLTGISPPVVVTPKPFAFTTNLHGDFRVPSRSCSVRYRRGRLDRWITVFDGQGRSSSRFSSARRPLSGRCERVCQPAARRQGALSDPRNRKVGDRLRHVHVRA